MHEAFEGELDNNCPGEDWDDIAEDWCTKGRYFERQYKATFKDKEAFLVYYAKREWSGDDVQLLRRRDTFYGPMP